MKIGVFAYNFKHWKTQAGIQNLCMAGYKPEVVLAADPVKLNFYQSKIFNVIFYLNPEKLNCSKIDR